MPVENRARYDVRGLDLASGIEPLSGLMTDPIRGDFLIHVDVKTILANREAKKHDQVVMIRDLNDMDNPVVARELAWDGPSRFVHYDFQKIPGTEIQNWVETDAPLTCRKDGEPTTVLCRDGEVRKSMMSKHIQGKWVIHIQAPILINNRKTGRNDPVIAVRSVATDWANDVIFCRHVEWNGPTRMIHRPTTPVPGTAGRGVSYIETDAVLTVYIDEQPPIILYNWDYPKKEAA